MTGALVGINALLFAFAWPKEQRDIKIVTRDQIEDQASRLAKIVLAGESGLKDEERAALEAAQGKTPWPNPAVEESFHRIQTDPLALSAEARYRWSLVYPLFEASSRTFKEKSEQSTIYRDFGFHPGKSWLPGIISHQFLHAGAMHLISNMVFLWVIGCVLEPVLGLWLIGLYLAGGVSAALAQGYWGGIARGDVMVGASGAISALMGYALISATQAPVKLFYLLLVFIVPRYGLFDAPLWFFLPLWLFDQLFMSLMTRNGEAVHVAFMAHFGGFAAGVLLGLSQLCRIRARS
ncbi:MAG: rhomboid family intramembrane serine protease [Elusimicrobia bacterium]|nr:rhomboid family intramembrane serine protease [Elusimicrobiota bacterium]